MAEIRLSDRMQMNVDLVTESTVADIGCDHAFLSIYLILKNIAQHVYAMDVKEGPLDIAKSNISSYGLENKISVRLSDGFSALNVGEAECAIIAGMGGSLMVKILSEGRCHTDAGIHLILQPQSEIERVRKYLFDIGYDIILERMTFDDGKYYSVMKAVPAEKAVKPYRIEELLYGRELLKQKNPVLKRYLQDVYKRNNELLLNLTHIHTDRSEKRIRELSDQCIILNNALSVYE